MLASGKPDDTVWMVIDNEIVPGRLISLVHAGDAGPSGLRAIVRYSDPARGLHRSCFAESCFPESDYHAAERLAKNFFKIP